MLKVKNGGRRLFLGVQSVHPRLTTARIKGKPLLEKNVSTKANTNTKTDKNTTTKTCTQTNNKYEDRQKVRTSGPPTFEGSLHLEKYFSGPKQNTKKCILLISPKTRVLSCFRERQFCQMVTCP